MGTADPRAQAYVFAERDVVRRKDFEAQTGGNVTSQLLEMPVVLAKVMKFAVKSVVERLESKMQ